MAVPPRLLDNDKLFFGPGGASLFGLDKRITKALAKMGLIRPTLVQAEVIPLALKGKDVLVKSATGSGKTLAYLIPMVQKLLSRQGATAGIRAAVLVPTRELCSQVERQLRDLCYYSTDAISIVSLGEGSLESRKAKLAEAPEVVICTPGRLAEHLKLDGDILRGSLETLVVDEADLVLSFGYEADIRLIVARAPRTCQGFLMSATLEEDMKGLKSVVLNEPVVVKLQQGGDAEGDAPADLAQWYVTLGKGDKDLVVFALLRLQLIAPGKALFFVNTVDRGYRLRLVLEQFGVRAAVLNAELPVNSRRHILDAFDKGVFDNLIVTDDAIGRDDAASSEAGSDADDDDGGGDDDVGVSAKTLTKQRAHDYSASRGIDFRGVLTVVNVDMPADSDVYVHRVGRTARAGASGTALSLIADAADQSVLEAVQARLPPQPDGSPTPGRLSLDVSELEGFRYRVHGMSAAVTRKAVREARLRDLRAEMINAETLKAHFAENPRDLALLKHDAPLKALKVQRHLAHVPSYLVPGALLPELASTSAAATGDGADDDAEAGRTSAKRQWQARHKRGKTYNKAQKKKQRRKDALF